MVEQQVWDSWDWEDPFQDASSLTCLVSDPAWWLRVRLTWDVHRSAYMWLLQHGSLRIIGLFTWKLSALRMSVPCVPWGSCMVSYEVAVGLT